jgi:hypothetical protein
MCKDKNILNTYVGLTINFEKRKRTHELNVNNLKKGKLYDVIRGNGGWENWDMVIIEKCCCNNRKEAGIREKYWYETLNADLNKNYPSRNCYEWYEANKERLLEIQKGWNEKKKEERLIAKKLRIEKKFENLKN